MLLFFFIRLVLCIHIANSFQTLQNLHGQTLFTLLSRITDIRKLTSFICPGISPLQTCISLLCSRSVLQISFQNFSLSLFWWIPWFWDEISFFLVDFSHLDATHSLVHFPPFHLFFPLKIKILFLSTLCMHPVWKEKCFLQVC